MKFQITETCVYTLEADSREEAEEIFVQNSPGLPDAPVAFREVSNREFEEVKAS